MSENFERIPLGAEEEDLVAGGRLTYQFYPDGWHIFSPSNPNVVYTFTDPNPSNQHILEVKLYEARLKVSDAEAIDNLMNVKHWIKPL